uniref:Potassium channel blocker AbTx19 n=1 Tax=Androctonus bicolor TaxID=748906 RepID=A0A0K0LBX8_9SCOR|nr:potassium channel blocker AbTx19 [Androctonus bicolor]
MNRIGKITVMFVALISTIAIISETRIQPPLCNPMFCAGWCRKTYKKHGECRSDQCVCTERVSISIKKPKTKQLIR